MARTAWEIDEEELDVEQNNVRRLRVDGSFVVKGTAGSGKTNLALWRAKRIKETEDGSVKVLVYTKALSAFISDGIRRLEIGSANVIHYHLWKGEPVDFVIVDEAQDFAASEIERLIKAARKSIMFFGDTAQQLYATKKVNRDDENFVSTVSMEEIAMMLGGEVRELKNNYRLPQGIAPFAQELNIRNNDIISNCKNTRTGRPRVIRFPTWQSELDFVISEITTRNLKDVAILLPFNDEQKATRGRYSPHYSVTSVRDYLNSKGVKNLCKVHENVELDFESDLPKIMTYHSSKGLQFDTVFIPHCGVGDNGSDTFFLNPLYVAVTRTSNNLVITHSDKLSPYIAKISGSHYETR